MDWMSHMRQREPDNEHEIPDRATLMGRGWPPGETVNIFTLRGRTGPKPDVDTGYRL